MKKKILYWSPCLNKVGTVKSTINSAISIKKFSKSNFEPFIINISGEWDEYLDIFKSHKIEVINFYKISYFKYLPKTGFFKSRFSYVVMFIFSFIPLVKLLKKNSETYIVAHLITSLPLLLFYLFNFKSKLILRISGFPKLNFLRKFFWKTTSNNIHVVTCPSIDLLEKLKQHKIFKNEKLAFLPDAIFQIKEFIDKKNTKLNFQFSNKKKNILAIGRLTKQKNFSYLIEEFSIFHKDNKDFNLLIAGDGEERDLLQKKIKSKNLDKNIFLLGRLENVFNLINKSEIFVLSSLWEDPGFVLIEAGLGNLFVISSDCPNGPREILSNGENGYLFENNKRYSLVKKLIEYIQLDNKTKFEMKTKLKKNIVKYSIFKHYLYLRKIINN